jgi:hypothetical protein
MSDDAHAKVDEMLDEIQVKHFEMAGMIGEYRTMLLKLQNEHDDQSVSLAQGLPGARYHVASKYVDEQWKVLSAQLKSLYGGS